MENIIQRRDTIQAELQTLSIARSLRTVGLITGTIGVFEILLSALAYMAVNPGFNLLDTYLSDIGATPVWPQIFFNAGMLIVSPLRYIVLVLLVLRLYQMGARRIFGYAALIMGVFTTIGTVIMTAVPYSVDVTIHMIGMPLFFFGVVFLQAIIGVQEWKIKAIPRSLPGLCFIVVAIYLIFFTLEILYQMNLVGRSTPVLWEWLCSISLLAWVFAHSISLGKDI